MSIREASLPSMGLEIEDTIIVVDEAHNLPNRIRMGLERRLTNQVIRDAFNEMEEHRGFLDNHMAKMMGKNQDNEIHHNDLENARKSEAALSRIRENFGTYIENSKKC